jgi:hypothetical protein
MLSGWSRALVLIAAAALLANTQCYGACVAAACKSPQVPTNGCHHHKSPPEDQGCPHRHPEFAGPQPAVANVSVTGAVSLAVVAVVGSAAVMDLVLPLQADNGSPPEHIRSSISILRI